MTSDYIHPHFPGTIRHSRDPLTGERLPSHDKTVMIDAIVTAKVRAREQHNDSKWRKICHQLPAIVTLVNSGTLSRRCCDANPMGQIPTFYWNHKVEIDLILDPKLECLPDLQATVAAQWQAVVQAATDGSPEQWRRSLAAEHGYTKKDMQLPGGIIRRLVDNIQKAKAKRARRDREKEEG